MTSVLHLLGSPSYCSDLEGKLAGVHEVLIRFTEIHELSWVVDFGREGQCAAFPQLHEGIVDFGREGQCAAFPQLHEGSHKILGSRRLCQCVDRTEGAWRFGDHAEVMMKFGNASSLVDFIIILGGGRWRIGVRDGEGDVYDWKVHVVVSERGTGLDRRIHRGFEDVQRVGDLLGSGGSAGSVPWNGNFGEVPEV